MAQAAAQWRCGLSVNLPALSVEPPARGGLLTVAELAARLEMRLLALDDDADAIFERCVCAVDAGIAAVLCRPDQLSDVVPCLEGSEVVLTAVMDYFHPHGLGLSRSSMAARAQRLADRGARDVALVCSRRDIEGGDTEEFAQNVTAIAQTLADYGGSARVLLKTEDMSNADVEHACRILRDTGTRLVQAGTWRGDRTRLGQLNRMREALGPDVLLKWTQPVRRLDFMLLAMAEGVDRFDADIGEILSQAAEWQLRGPIRVPVPGVDF